MSHGHFENANVSADLVWHIVRPYNSYLVKRTSGGGSQFSRDPLNLTNKHSRKHAGFVNNKAVGINGGEKGPITLTTKKTKHPNRPAANRNEVTYGQNASSRKIYKSVVNLTVKNGYRPDLRQAAVARASALKQAQQPKKEMPEKKLRGAKQTAAAKKS